MSNVHKDFHGCFSYGLKFLEEKYGPAEVEEYLRRTARNIYAPLIESLCLRGLPALEEHWNNVMTLEGAGYSLYFTNDDELVLEVSECPAIHHMRQQGYAISGNFCESTSVANDEICRAAGYIARVDYDQENGICVQRFRKDGSR